MLRSAVFVVTYSGYSIIFFLTVIRNIMGSSFCGLMLTTMRVYVNVRPAGIMLRDTKRIVFVTFSLFLVIYLQVVQNSFESLFFQRSRVSFSFDLIRSLYCRIPPVFGLITVLKRYQGEGSSSIFVAVLCKALVIAGAILFIYCCVTIGTLLDVTLGCCSGFFLRFYMHFTCNHPWRSSRFYSFWCLHRYFT